MKKRLAAEIFLTWPIASVENSTVSVFDPMKKTFWERLLFTEERNRTILFFYPADFSYVCPTELAKLNALFHSFHMEGAELLVISRDSLLVHQKRVEMEPQLAGFKIKMVSDKEATIGKSIWLLNTSSGEYERAILVCSPEGKVAYMQISNASLWRNIEDLLRVVQWLNHLLRHPERLCQEDWHDGEAGIQECVPETHVFVH